MISGSCFLAWEVREAEAKDSTQTDQTEEFLAIATTEVGYRAWLLHLAAGYLPERTNRNDPRVIELVRRACRERRVPDVTLRLS